MLLKFMLAFVAVGVWAEDLPGVSRARMVNYQPTCDDTLVQERRELMRASFAREGFQLLQNMQPVSNDAIEILYGKIAEQISGHGTYDFTDKINPGAQQVPVVLEPVLQYVREAIHQVTLLGYRDERNLTVVSAEVHVQKVRSESNSNDAYMVKMRQDDGSTVISITFKGTPTFVRSNGQLVPVPSGVPVVLSGLRRAAKFPQIEATDYGEPFRMENRLEIVVKLRPSRGGPIRFELVQ